MSSFHALEPGAMYFGSDDLGFSIEQRGVMFEELSQRQADRTETFDNLIMDAHGIDPRHFD